MLEQRIKSRSGTLRMHDRLDGDLAEDEKGIV